MIEVFIMNDENNLSNSLPEEINYTPESEKKGAPTGVSAPVLDDFGYAAPSAKKDGPTGVSAPVLDDMDSYSKAAKKGAPTGVSAPVLDDSAPYVHEKLVLSDEDVIGGLTPELKARFDALPTEKQQQIIDMRRAQLGAVAPPEEVKAPVLDEDIYVPPQKTEKPVQTEAPLTAPVLDDEPDVPKYQPKYINEDLERAKADASKNAVSSQLSYEKKDSKESLRMLHELQEQNRQKQAAKGFVITIVLAVLGIVAAAMFFVLYSGQGSFEYVGEMGGIKNIVKNSSLYIAVGVGVLSLSLIAGINGLKSLTSFVMLLFGIIQVVPGAMMISQHGGNTALKIVFYAVPLVFSWVVFFMLAGSEDVGQFFNKKNRQ